MRELDKVLKWMRRFNRNVFSSSSLDCLFGGRWWGVGLGAGVGGEAGADGSRFAGIGVTVFLEALRERAGVLVKEETESRVEGVEWASSWSDMGCELIGPSAMSLKAGSGSIARTSRMGFEAQARWCNPVALQRVFGQVVPCAR